MLTFFSNLAEILAGLIRAGKWPVVGAFIIVTLFGGLAIGGKTYVDDKLDEITEKADADREKMQALIDAERDKNQQMVSTLTVMQGTLNTVSDAMKDVKDAMRVSDQKVSDTQKMVIDIYRNQRGS